MSSLSLRRMVSRSNHRESTPPTSVSEAAQEIRHSDTTNTLLSTAETLGDPISDPGAPAQVPAQVPGQLPEELHPAAPLQVPAQPPAEHKPLETNLDFSPLSTLNRGDSPPNPAPLISSSFSHMPATNLKDTGSATAPEAPGAAKGGKPEEAGRSLIGAVLEALVQARNTLVTVATNTANLAKDGAYKTVGGASAFTQRVVNTFRGNPLLTYDTLYVGLCAALATGAHYYHKGLVNSNLTCTNCVNKNMRWEVIAGVSTCVGVFGLGNYLYLRGQGKPGKGLKK